MKERKYREKRNQRQQRHRAKSERRNHRESVCGENEISAKRNEAMKAAKMKKINNGSKRRNQ